MASKKVMESMFISKIHTMRATGSEIVKKDMESSKVQMDNIQENGVMTKSMEKANLN